MYISPPIENTQVSGPETAHKTDPAKKEGLGVFAKILAGLLRKVGEKNGLSAGDEAPGAEKTGLDITDAEFSGSEEISALFPGRPGAARGKRPDGIPGAEAAGAEQTQNWRKIPAGAAENEKHGEDMLFSLPWNSPHREPETGKHTGIPAKRDLPPAGGEAISAEGEQEGFLTLDSLDFGALLGAEGNGAAEGAGKPGGRKEKTGGVYADSPEENFSTRPEEAAPGLFPGGIRRGGSGEGDRGDPRSRLAEPRQKDRRRDKITLEVQDFRTGEERNAGALGTQSVQGLENRPPAGRGEAEILVELRGGNPGRQAPQTADHTWESRAGRSFEDFLARELHQNLNGDIVRHASVALRDGGEGTIRLSLRPESLGNVKIRLEMADNKVTGHIVVESEAALRAFQRELASLEQAFRNSGFEGAALDMSLAREGGMDRGWNGENPDRPATPERLAALSYEAVPEGPDLLAAEAPAGIFTRNGRVAVNMLA
jgi:hypothetical protein